MFKQWQTSLDYNQYSSSFKKNYNFICNYCKTCIEKKLYKFLCPIKCKNIVDMKENGKVNNDIPLLLPFCYFVQDKYVTDVIDKCYKNGKFDLDLIVKYCEKNEKLINNLNEVMDTDTIQLLNIYL